MAEETSTRKKLKGCPICGQPADERYRPFCSKRCADVDLGRWLGERYVVPGDAPFDPGDGEAGTVPDENPDEP